MVTGHVAGVSGQFSSMMEVLHKESKRCYIRRACVASAALDVRTQVVAPTGEQDVFDVFVLL
jgi:hypothetical protein